MLQVYSELLPFFDLWSIAGGTIESLIKDGMRRTHDGSQCFLVAVLSAVCAGRRILNGLS